MIYCITGTDNQKRKIATEKVVGNFVSQNFPINRFSTKDLDILEELAGSTGLFFEKHVSVFDQVLEKKEHSEILLSKIEILKDSLNIFIFIEQSLLKDTSDAFKKHAEIFEVFDMPKDTYKGFNVFTLTDAFCNRDKKSLWILYQKALMENIVVEEILHKLFWQVKMLLIIKSNPNPDQLKRLVIKDFTFNKSKASVKNFTDVELHTLQSSYA